MQSTKSLHGRKARCNCRAHRTAPAAPVVPAPAPRGPEAARHRVYDMVAESDMNRDAERIATKAEELHEALHRFVRTYDGETLASLLHARGFSYEQIEALGWAVLEDDLLEDARGFLWGLGVFCSIFGTQVLATAETREKWAAESRAAKLAKAAK